MGSDRACVDHRDLSSASPRAEMDVSTSAEIAGGASEHRRHCVHRYRLSGSNAGSPIKDERALRISTGTKSYLPWLCLYNAFFGVIAMRQMIKENGALRRL